MPFLLRLHTFCVLAARWDNFSGVRGGRKRVNNWEGEQMITVACSYLWEAGNEDLNSLRGRWDHPTARASSLTGDTQQGMTP